MDPCFVETSKKKIQLVKHLSIIFVINTFEIEKHKYSSSKFSYKNCNIITSNQKIIKCNNLKRIIT